MKACKFNLLAAILFSSAGAQAEAEPLHPLLGAKHTFVLGAYRQTADAEFFADPDRVGRANISLGDLGVEDTDTSYLLEYRYRLNEKWLFSIGTYRFRTDGKIEAKRNFMYDGVEFEAGARLDSKLDVDTYLLEAMYSVYKTDRAEILLGGGLHLFDFNAAIKVRVAVGDQERSGSRASSDILAPLPNFRAQGLYAFSPKWALETTLGWLSANYENYDGSFAYIHARTMYRFSERFGVGIGYQYVDTDLTHERQRGDVGFEIQFDGPAVYLGYSL